MNWRSHSNRFDNCDIHVSRNDDGMIVVDGSLKNLYKNYSSIIGRIFIKYWSPNASNNTNNVSGVSIPFTNEAIAYEYTVNKGLVRIENDKFRFNLYRPQSYYTNTSKEPVPANVKFVFCDKKMRPFSGVYYVNL